MIDHPIDDLNRMEGAILALAAGMAPILDKTAKDMNRLFAVDPPAARPAPEPAGREAGMIIWEPAGSQPDCAYSFSFGSRISAADAEASMERGITVHRSDAPEIDGLHLPRRFLNYDQSRGTISGTVRYVILAGVRYGLDGREWVRLEEDARPSPAEGAAEGT